MLSDLVGVWWHGSARAMGHASAFSRCENALFGAIYIQNDQFTMTGSGQSMKVVEKEKVFSADMQLPLEETDVAAHDKPPLGYVNVSLFRCCSEFGAMAPPSGPMLDSPLNRSMQQVRHSLHF